MNSIARIQTKLMYWLLGRRCRCHRPTLFVPLLLLLLPRGIDTRREEEAAAQK